MLRGETGDTGELQRLHVRKGIADLDRTVVMNADDVARVGLVHMETVLGHENGGVGQGDVLADAVMAHFHAAGEPPGTDADECDAVPVGRIHIGLNLKGKAGKGGLGGLHLPGDGHPWTGRRRQFHEGVEEFADAEVVDGAAKKDRRLTGLEEFAMIERISGALHQFDVRPQLPGLTAQKGVQLRVAEVGDDDTRLLAGIPSGGEEMDLPAVEIVDPPETLAHADGP